MTRIPVKIEVIKSISKGDVQTIEGVNSIVIHTEEAEFRLHVNNFNELIINKEFFGEGRAAITIEPRVSNEISIK